MFFFHIYIYTYIFFAYQRRLDSPLESHTDDYPPPNGPIAVKVTVTKLNDKPISYWKNIMQRCACVTKGLAGRMVS